MPCMHIAFSHCFRWHFLFAGKRAYPSEQRTNYPNGFHTHLDRKHDGPDFRHRLPGSRLSSVQQAQGQHAQTGHSPCPGFHRMAAMLESPPCSSVLSGRQHPADSLHLHESHQYDNHNIGLYIRILHDVSGDKNDRMYRAIKPNKYKFSDIQITESVISFTERKLQYAANFTQKHKKFAIHCKFPEKFRIFGAHFIFSNQDRMQNE